MTALKTSSDIVLIKVRRDAGARMTTISLDASIYELGVKLFNGEDSLRDRITMEAWETDAKLRNAAIGKIVGSRVAKEIGFSRRMAQMIVKEATKRVK